MVIILSGSIGRSVTGGQAWANLQYLIGLRSLGHDVYYLEDCGEWSSVYNFEAGEQTWDPSYPASYIREAIEPYGFTGKWIYRVGEGSEGLTISQFREVCGSADLLIIRGIPFITWREEYNYPRRRVFIDVDPGFTQFRLARKEPAFVETTGRCEKLFTIGKRIGSADCPIPTDGREWLKTVSPVSLSEWPVSNHSGNETFTSIMRWRGMKDLTYRGVTYGQRDREFPDYLTLPQLVSQRLRVAMTGGSSKKLGHHGWEVVSGHLLSRTTDTYRAFIQDSRAEFGVAKHCYVATHSGWFSDRSVCYLASGRPVLLQDTGLKDWLPIGEGALTFCSLPEAVEKIAEINKNYEEHRRAARDLAETYFSAERVLPKLLDLAAG